MFVTQQDWKESMNEEEKETFIHDSSAELAVYVT